MTTHYIAHRKATIKANRNHGKMEFPWALMKPQDLEGMDDITEDELNDPQFRLDFANAFPSDEVRVYSINELKDAMPTLGRVKLEWTRHKVPNTNHDPKSTNISERFPFNIIHRYATTVEDVLAS